MSGPRPTPAGRALALSSVACLLAGALLGYPELRIVGATGAVALAVAVPFVVRRPSLQVGRVVEPPRVRRGEPARGLLEIEHAGFGWTWTTAAVDRVAGEPVVVDVPRLARGRSKIVRYPLPTHRRGRFAVGPLVVVSSDPLRLLGRQAVASGVEYLWVHPRVLPVGTAPTGLARDLEGPAADRAPDGTITFRSLREYVVGDDLRRVHWRSSARTGTLMVRQHVDPSRPELALLLDDRAAAYGDEELSEQAVDLAASLAVGLRTDGFPCRVSAVSGRGVLGGDVQSDPRLLLDGLAELAVADQSSDRVLDRAVAALPGGSAAVLVTGRPSADDLQRLLGLRRRYAQVVALCLTSEALPTARGVQVLAAPSADLLLRRWQAEAGR